MKVISKNFREEIQSRFDTESFHVPEWDSEVRIRKHTLQERKKLANLHQQNKDKDGDGIDTTTNILSLSICDENGALVFSSKDDLHWLEENLTADTAKDLLEKVLKFNGVNTEAIEESEKNSETTQSAVSSSS